MNNDQRKGFARAIVALARAHGVQSIAVQYRDGWRTEPRENGQFHIAWAEGRHGAESTISCEYRDTLNIPEADDEKP